MDIDTKFVQVLTKVSTGLSQKFRIAPSQNLASEILKSIYELTPEELSVMSAQMSTIATLKIAKMS